VQLTRSRLLLSSSDLTGYLACPHLTTLSLAVARGDIPRPYRHNPHAELIRRKGQEREAAYLASLGEGVVRIGEPWVIGWEAAAQATTQAMHTGAPVIYQATFIDGPWRGLSTSSLRVHLGGRQRGELCLSESPSTRRCMWSSTSRRARGHAREWSTCMTGAHTAVNVVLGDLARS
jgi:hypothetical protein